MAYAFVQAQENSASTGQTSLVLPSMTVGAGHTLIAVMHSVYGSTNTVTDGGVGNVFYFLGTIDNGFGGSEYIYLCQNSVAAATVFTVNCSSADLSGVWIGEYSGLATSGLVSGSAFNSQNGTTNGANSAVSGTFTIGAVPAMLFGYCYNWTGGFAPTAGTSPVAFTTRGPNWPNYTGGARACTEDARVTVAGVYGATFGTGSVGSDGWNTFAMVLPENVPPPFAPFTSMQFFVTDTIIQQ